MIPQDGLTIASASCLAQGIRLLQGFRLAQTDEDHIAALLHWMDPKPDTHWLDIGSGFGEAARLMHQQRPDLHFTLVNNNAYQIDHTPSSLHVARGDMHDLPFDDAQFDGCMFLWSLCHADDDAAALGEAARVTKPGGRLFVFDFDRTEGDNTLLFQHLYAAAFPLRDIKQVAKATGWHWDFCVHPLGSDALFRAIAGNDDLYDAIFKGVRPVIWRARRAADA